MNLAEVIDVCAPIWSARSAVYPLETYRLAVRRFERFLRRDAQAGDVTPEALADFRRWCRRETLSGQRVVIVSCCCLERLAAECRGDADKLLTTFVETNELASADAQRAICDLEIWAGRCVLLTDLHANFLQAWKHDRAPFWRVVVGVAMVNAIIAIWERVKAAKRCRYHAPERLKVEPGLSRVPSIYRRIHGRKKPQMPPPRAQLITAVVRLRAQGFTFLGIGRQLDITTSTAKCIYQRWQEREAPHANH